MRDDLPLPCNYFSKQKEDQQARTFKVEFSLEGLTGGIYFYKLQRNNFV